MAPPKLTIDTTGETVGGAPLQRSRLGWEDFQPQSEPEPECWADEALAFAASEQENFEQALAAARARGERPDDSDPVKQADHDIGSAFTFLKTLLWGD